MARIEIYFGAGLAELISDFGDVAAAVGQGVHLGVARIDRECGS